MGTNNPLSWHLVPETMSNVKVSKMERICPLWRKNEINKFQGDLPIRFRSFSWCLMKVQNTHTRSPKKSRILVWGTWMSTVNFMAIWSVGCCHIIFLQTKVTYWHCHSHTGLLVEQKKTLCCLYQSKPTVQGADSKQTSALFTAL